MASLSLSFCCPDGDRAAARGKEKMGKSEFASSAFSGLGEKKKTGRKQIIHTSHCFFSALLGQRRIVFFLVFSTQGVRTSQA